jgi:osmotically-inducible protein OsmY
MVGGFVGGTMVASDRRTAGAQLEDQGIELRASTRIREQIGSGVHINVTSYNRQVLLTGEVSKAQEKQLAEQV